MFAKRLICKICKRRQSYRSRIPFSEFEFELNRSSSRPDMLLPTGYDKCD